MSDEETDFDTWFNQWLEHMEREIEVIHESERITADDLAIIVY